MVTKLGRYLNQHGLKQTDFAEKADLPAPMISLWARGLRRPGLASALKIEKATEGEVPAAYWAAFQTEH